MPLAIVIYVDGSFIKNKISVKPIYITVRNLNSVVSGKSLAWLVLGMLPALKKKPLWIPSIGSVLQTLTCFVRVGR